MSEQVTNLKVRFGADTKNFKKGLDDGKHASRQFQKTAGSAFDSFAEAFGVNMGKVREGLNTVKTSLTGTAGGFKAATTGSNVFTKSLGILKAALIATGVGALVVALGSLISYFTKTQRGADFVSRTMRAVGAVTNVLVDRFSSLGEMIFKAFSNPREAISDLWEAIKTNIVNRFEGLITLFAAVGGGLEALWKRDMKGLKEAANEAGTAIVQMTTGMDEGQQQRFAESVKGLTNEIKEESKASAELEKRRQALRDKEIALIEVQAERRKELEAARLLARDETVSAEERLEAIQRAVELEKQSLEENKALQKERIAVMQQEVDLAESMASDYRALAEEKAKLHEIEQQSFSLQRRASRDIIRLTGDIEAQTEAVKKLREEQTKMYTPLDSLGLEIPKIELPKLETEKLMSGLKPALDEAQDAILDFGEIFNNTFGGLAESFGEYMGNLFAGTEGLENFGNFLLSSLGGIAIQVGKMAIATGIAVSGIKKALMSMNPAVAIAAGVALVALGTAIKGALSNAVSGGGGGAGTIGQNSYVYDARMASAGVGQTATGMQVQAVDVHVTGTFKQRGTELVATINETQKRSGYRG